VVDTDTLLAGGSLSPLIAIVVELIKAAIPCRLWDGPGSNARSIGLTFVVGIVMAVGAWWLGYLPNWVTWRDAIRTGVTAAVGASGLYSQIKALRNPDPEPALDKPPIAPSAPVVIVRPRTVATGKRARKTQVSV